MKKLSFIVLLFVSFFAISFTAKASCLNDDEYFRQIYDKAPNKNWDYVAYTSEMKDFSDNTVTIRIYEDPVDNILYFYKKISGREEYRLLACIGELGGEIVENTYIPLEQSPNYNEDCPSAPIFNSNTTCPTRDENECDNTLAPGKGNENYSAIRDEIKRFADSDDTLVNLANHLGLVYSKGNKMEGFAYSSRIDDYAGCDNIDQVLRFPKDSTLNKNPNYNPKKADGLKVLYSNYVIKLRGVIKNKLEPRAKENYTKNPCEMKGVLKALRISRRVLNIIKILVPIVLIIMGSVELSKAVISSDNAQMNKSIKSLFIKVIIGIFIFFIPTLMNVFSNLLPRKSFESFYNCRACFFGDEKYSSTTCDMKINGESSLENDENELYTDWRNVEYECIKKYDDYVDKLCSKVPNENKAQCVKGATVESYMLTCTCDSSLVNGYTRDAAIEKCEELYPKSKRDQGYEKVIESYNNCLDTVDNPKTNILVKVCKDQLESYYKNPDVINKLLKEK